MIQHPALHIGIDTSGPATVVMPVGALGMATAPQLRDTLLKCIADQPEAVIVDLALMQVQTSYALSMFSVVARRTADWSGVPLLLVSGPPVEGRLNLRSKALSRFVRVFPTLEAAKAAVHKPPLRLVSSIELAPEPDSSVVARRFAENSCRRWGQDEVADDAAVIAAELTMNAIEHARPPISLRLELRRQLLTVAVTDGSPRPPALLPSTAPALREHGHGLVIVSTLAHTWGHTATSTGGKVVWAVLSSGSATAAEQLSGRRARAVR